MWWGTSLQAGPRVWDGLTPGGGGGYFKGYVKDSRRLCDSGFWRKSGGLVCLSWSFAGLSFAQLFRGYSRFQGRATGGRGFRILVWVVKLSKSPESLLNVG